MSMAKKQQVLFESGKLLKEKKSCIRKLNTENDKTTSNPKEILNEIQSFYANLYDKKVDHSDENLMESFLCKVDINTLTDEQQDSVDNQLTISQCFAVLTDLSEK